MFKAPRRSILSIYSLITLPSWLDTNLMQISRWTLSSSEAIVSRDILSLFALLTIDCEAEGYDAFKDRNHQISDSGYRGSRRCDFQLVARWAWSKREHNTLGIMVIVNHRSHSISHVYLVCSVDRGVIGKWEQRGRYNLNGEYRVTISPPTWLY